MPNAGPAGRRSVYHGFARVYDRLVGDAWFPTIRRSFERIVRHYGISFRSVADLGCGTGTFVRYLSRRVPVVYGVDHAPAMLRIAAVKTEGSGVRLVRGDLAHLQLPERVDLMTCNFDTLNYVLSARTLSQVFARCRAHLTGGGHFLFDMILAPRHSRAREAEVHVLKAPGVLTRWAVTWNARQRRSRVEMLYWLRSRSGRWYRTREVHVQRWYSLPQICSVLARAGFVVRGVHDMETFRAATPETAWAKFVAAAA